MKNDLRVRCVQSLFLFSCYDFIHDRIICMRKDFFSLLLWLLGDGFNTTWQDVLHWSEIRTLWWKHWRHWTRIIPPFLK